MIALLKDRWKNGDFFVCDDSVRFKFSQFKGGIAVYDSSGLIQQIQRWIAGNDLNGQHRPWSIGYWLPEAFLGDLASADVLFDAKEFQAEIMELLNPYPSIFSQSLIQYCLEEIKLKLPMLENASEIERRLCHSDIIKSLIRFCFARSRCYLRGFRSLPEQAKLLKESDYKIYELAVKNAIF